MSIDTELKTVLKRLKLSGILPTLPDRLAYARKEKIDYTQFLELVLSDEVERRDQKHVTNRLTAAGFEEECMLERFDGNSHTLPITRNFLRASPSLDHIMPLKVSLLLFMGESIGKVEHTYS